MSKVELESKSSNFKENMRLNSRNYSKSSKPKKPNKEPSRRLNKLNESASNRKKN